MQIHTLPCDLFYGKCTACYQITYYEAQEVSTSLKLMQKNLTYCTTIQAYVLLVCHWPDHFHAFLHQIF
ncbi:uncharacterized protein CANTADRAFT_26237 [Suhomyces tanzawaensis NRRL Y-17324]|uniref:Uncharacterized protein n=1 Tax=Suhomyces tanzawaensis NRRL Y-17324 TaxID=984487 RepID=A0A1E4SIC6_9ASCO|nr:uncharacterized protein CANTADRAFT_26237 [Suhomyces tanzawaensis NRRL Y-17324]ODV79253.1 hypothetical protein CANTADRAFT_26237 [Suhomyces tanzawaensis NRRL Y-17324]